MSEAGNVRAASDALLAEAIQKRPLLVQPSINPSNAAAAQLAEFERSVCALPSARAGQGRSNVAALTTQATCQLVALLAAAQQLDFSAKAEGEHAADQEAREQSSLALANKRCVWHRGIAQCIDVLSSVLCAWRFESVVQINMHARMDLCAAHPSAHMLPFLSTTMACSHHVRTCRETRARLQRMQTCGSAVPDGATDVALVPDAEFESEMTAEQAAQLQQAADPQHAGMVARLLHERARRQQLQASLQACKQELVDAKVLLPWIPDFWHNSGHLASEVWQFDRFEHRSSRMSARMPACHLLITVNDRDAI